MPATVRVPPEAVMEPAVTVSEAVLVRPAAENVLALVIGPLEYIPATVSVPPDAVIDPADTVSEAVDTRPAALKEVVLVMAPEDRIPATVRVPEDAVIDPVVTVMEPVDAMPTLETVSPPEFTVIPPASMSRPPAFRAVAPVTESPPRLIIVRPWPVIANTSRGNGPLSMATRNKSKESDKLRCAPTSRTAPANASCVARISMTLASL
mmetsp:Transcript_1048/g.3139  ORF Transcript_1048/g.3139 Transcript_1048/m.3139 type:complete len:208 (+) Transcript_1048:897-1520(+)